MRRMWMPVLLMALGVACQKTTPHVNEVVSVPAARITSNPADGVWNNAPDHVARLLPQDLVDPRLMKASTPEVHVRSVNNGSQIAFRLTWPDATNNDLPGAGRFLDGCGVQIPRKVEANPPDPQMGEAGRPVDIVFWRADWQASVNGRKDTIQSLYPNASVDHYPFEAKSLEPGSAAQKEMAMRYAPAHAMGNRRVGPRETPVEELTAEGPGTLGPAPASGAGGQGVRTADGWSVVITRKLPEGLAPRVRTQIALAVWEGSAKEAGARKMRTGWIPLSVQEAK